ncbi:MAG TPA: diaminopimelate epimerase [Rhizomicrobium sp.]
MTAFLKMHGLGNDFVVFDARQKPLALTREQARHIADRHFGVGCDQVIVIAPGRPGFDAVMKIWNADGGPVESCGNASRCVARLLMDETGKATVTIDTAGGALTCSDGGSDGITVDMGPARLDWEAVPLAEARDTKNFSLTLDGAAYQVSAASMGNPHCVLFVGDAEGAPVAELGPKIENHKLFPQRINVEFAQVLEKDRIRMRVWERGAGITLACGTGACATAVAAHRLGLTGRDVEIVLDGGSLFISIRASDGHVLMTGPTTLAFRGEISL